MEPHRCFSHKCYRTKEVWEIKGGFCGRAGPDRSEPSRVASHAWELAWEDTEATMRVNKGRRRVLVTSNGLSAPGFCQRLEVSEH